MFNSRSDTPEKVMAAVENVTSDFLLSENSRKIYTKSYKDFLDWCSQNDATSYTEKNFIKFFSEKSQSCKPSTLWSHYSMLKTCFNLKQNIDISQYSKLIKYLKEKSEHHKPIESKIFTQDQTLKFIYEAPDKEFLMMKVVAIFGVVGACRRQELYNILTTDIEDVGNTIRVTIRSIKNKKSRTFSVSDNKEKYSSFLQIYRKYAAMRPSQLDHSHFFVFYRKGRCTKQPVGINQFGKIPSLIATFLNLPDCEMYNGHCFRRSSVPLQLDSEVDQTVVKREPEWEFSNVAEDYTEENKKPTTVSIIKTENQVVESVLVKEEEATSSLYSELTITEDELKQNDNVLNIIVSNISNCNNLTIKIHINK